MMTNFTLDHTFTHSLPADPVAENNRRKVTEACFSYVTPRKPSNPSLVHASKEMLAELAITEKESQEQWFLNMVSGNEVYPNTTPYAMCYGGHQFGHWAGQLGDGRAINLFTTNVGSQKWTLQLKGAGETPYSRRADGLAVLRSSIREHLCSEAMHHLGVPTTRSLSLALTGDQVLRDVMYDGNAAYEPGAVVCRVAPSFLRFGNFEIFASRRDKATLQQLVDYTIKTFFPQIKSEGKEAVIDFFREVSQSTMEMILHWQRVGFVHGVMNTDNMSILGLTIDYGPYGWLEDYNPNWTPNTTDREGKRYRYSWQPKMAQWNLMQLANSLFYLIEEAEPLEQILNDFGLQFNAKYLELMRSKLGLFEKIESDELLVKQLIELLYEAEVDYTIFFRELSVGVTNLHSILEKSSYQFTELDEKIMSDWKRWYSDYTERLSAEVMPSEERLQSMQLTNPKYVLRNYMAQLAIESAEKGDYSLIEELHELLKRPYDEQPEYEKWYAKRPAWAKHKVGCSMLSCSS